MLSNFFRRLVISIPLIIAPIFSQAAEILVTPNAMKKAQGLYAWLADQEGKKIISGQMEGDTNEGPETPFNRIHKLTGKYPALRGFDFGCYSPEHNHNIDDGTTQRAINWHQSNGIVAIQWHWYKRVPGGGVEVYATQPPGHQIPLTDFDIAKAVTPGTTENQRFLNGIDAIAIQLQRLKDAGVPVLWRPFHENSTGSFWWGTKGAEPLKSAWKIMFERLVKQKGLNNLIWVFNPASHVDLPTWYPGDEYVDIISYDAYGSPGEHGTYAAEYKKIKGFAGNGKLVTMSENGGIPDTSKIFSEGANWFSFMTWRGEWANSQSWNDDQLLISTYTSPNVLTKDELPNLNNLTARNPWLAVKLAFTRQPTNVFLGDSWPTAVYVAPVNLQGRIVRSYKGTVTFTHGNSSTNAPIINGVAKFQPTFNTISSNQTITAYTFGGLPVTSKSFNVGTANDDSNISFESRISGWVTNASALETTNLRAFAGSQSAKITINNSDSDVNTTLILENAGLATPPNAGKTVTTRIWIPEGTNLHGLYAYVQENATSNWRFTTGQWLDFRQVTAGQWNEVSVKIPDDAATIYSMGITIVPLPGKNLSGKFFIDSIKW